VPEPKPAPKRPGLLDDTKPAAPAPYARVTELRGSVQYRTSATSPWRWADVGQALPSTAQLRIGLNSHVSVVVLPDTRLTFNKISVVTLTDYLNRGSALPAMPSDALADADRSNENVHHQLASTSAINSSIATAPVSATTTSGMNWRHILVPSLLTSGLFDDSDDADAPPAKPADKKKVDLFNDDAPAAKPAKPTAPAKPTGGGLFDEDEDDKKATPAPVTPASLPLPASKLLTPAERLVAGGWYVDEENFAILYRPVGHANVLLKQWLTITAKAAIQPRKGTPSIGKVAFEELRQPDARIACFKCHSVNAIPPEKEAGMLEKTFAWADPSGHGPLTIPWEAKKPEVEA